MLYQTVHRCRYPRCRKVTEAPIAAQLHRASTAGSTSHAQFQQFLSIICSACSGGMRGGDLGLLRRRASRPRTHHPMLAGAFSGDLPVPSAIYPDWMRFLQALISQICLCFAQIIAMSERSM